MTLTDREAEIRSVLDLWKDDQRSREGCDCRSSRRPLDGFGTLALMVLLGLRARRRRRGV